MYVFTFSYGPKFKNTVIVFDQGTGIARHFDDNRLDFLMTRSVMVKKDLFVYKFGCPVMAYKYSNFTDVEQLVKV